MRTVDGGGVVSCSTVEIIAEAGVNHNGKLDTALELVNVAVNAGADSIKFQTFSAKDLVSPVAPLADYQQRSGQQGNQLTMLQALELQPGDFVEIASYCRQQQIEFLSSPFDVTSLSFLVNDLGVKRIKIASGEITNGPLLLAAAQHRCPVIVSTGMATLQEIEQALAVLTFGYHFSNAPKNLQECMEAFADEKSRAVLQDKVTLLHCTSQYPAPYNQLNLRAMNAMAERWQLPVGYSDHSDGITVPVVATALGAWAIEKHLTTDKNLPGPDHRASLTGEEFAAMVAAVRAAQASLGTADKQPQACEQNTAQVARKSVVALTEIQCGEVFTDTNIICQRPAAGISPMHYWALLQQPARNHYKAGDLIRE